MLIKDTEIVYSLVEDAASCSKTYQEVKEICENFSESVYLQVIDGNGGKSYAKVNNYVLLHDQITLFFPYGDKMIRLAHTEYGILSEEVSVGGAGTESIIINYNVGDYEVSCEAASSYVNEKMKNGEVNVYLALIPNSTANYVDILPLSYFTYYNNNDSCSYVFTMEDTTYTVESNTNRFYLPA